MALKSFLGCCGANDATAIYPASCWSITELKGSPVFGVAVRRNPTRDTDDRVAYEHAMAKAWDLSIRRCAPGDERRLSLVAQAAFLEAFAGTLPAADLLAHCEHQHSVDKYAGYLRDAASRVWIAEVAPGGAPVGYLVLTTPDLPLPDITPRDAEVKRVYLLNRFKGAGIGRQLMRTAEAHAKTAGHRRLLLGVYGGNAEAIAFYAKLGYRKVGTRRFKVGENTYDDLVMALELPTP